MNKTKHGTKIEWTHFPGYRGETWNPVMGCTPISEGCSHCYALDLINRFGGRKGWPTMTHRIELFPERLNQPSRWRKQRAIFVCSMGDLFPEEVSGNYINKVWTEMFNNPRHLFLVLTKRPERLLKWTEAKARATAWPIDEIWPQNVMLGVTVENRDYLYRMDVLRRVPAEKRFVSFEPLLGYIPAVDLDGISLCVVGGESGHNPRYMDSNWARKLRNNCEIDGVSFFMKQMSGRTPEERHAIPGDLMIQEFPEVWNG